MDASKGFNHWSSKEVGRKLGKLFHCCLNVILLENGSQEGKILKMLVEMKLDNPLLRGSKIKLKNEKHWVDFKYENLPVFCFYCGIIWHQERSCALKVNDAKERQVSEGQYGEWIHASLPLEGEKGL